MIIKSDVTHIEYQPEDVIWMKNILQAAAYYYNGAQLVDVDVQNGRWIFAIWRKDHERFKVAWNEHRLPVKDETYEDNGD